MQDLWFKFQASSAVIFSDLLAAIPLGAFVKLSLIGIIVGVVFVWLYSFVSFQKALAELKRKITAVALEPFLFRESLRVSILSPCKLSFLALKYLALSLPPLIILAIPMLWLLGIVNQAIGYEKAKAGDRLFVKIEADSPKDIRSLEIRPELQGFELSSLVRAPAKSEAYTELRATEAEQGGQISLKLKSDTIIIPVYGSQILATLTNSFWGKLVFPAGGIKLPPGLKEVSIEYPARYFNIFGLNLHWIIVFLLISIIAGLIFAKVFGIEV